MLHSLTLSLSLSLQQTILFTTDKEILTRVGLHDDCFQAELACGSEDVDETERERPSTGGLGGGEGGGEEGEGETFTDISPTHLSNRPHPTQLYGKGQLHSHTHCVPAASCVCRVYHMTHDCLQWWRCGCVLIGGRGSGWG